MAHYVIVASHLAEEGGAVISALDVLKTRIDRGVWPFSEHTRNRNAIKSGDAILFYLSGKGEHAQSFVAVAFAGSSVESIHLDEPEAWGNLPWRRGLKLRNVKFFRRPVSIRSILAKLEFIKTQHKWGAYLQGGCLKISEADYETILQSTTLLKASKTRCDTSDQESKPRM